MVTKLQLPQLDRRDAVAALLEGRSEEVVVTGLGSASYDVHSLGDNDRNYYLWGAMGGACLVGLGIAQARPDLPVVVITGDGEQIMALGGLATISAAACLNLTVVVLDNGHYGETGMQLSHAGLGLDLTAVAEACGFTHAQTLGTMDEVHAVDLADLSGPRLFRVPIHAKNEPRSIPSRDAVHIKNRFRSALGLPQG